MLVKVYPGTTLTTCRKPDIISFVRSELYQFYIFNLGKLSNRKSSQTWELVQIGGGRQKIKKVPKFQLGKVQKEGGVITFPKVSKFEK